MCGPVPDSFPLTNTLLLCAARRAGALAENRADVLLALMELTLHWENTIVEGMGIEYEGAMLALRGKGVWEGPGVTGREPAHQGRPQSR